MLITDTVSEDITIFASESYKKSLAFFVAIRYVLPVFWLAVDIVAYTGALSTG